VTFLGDAEPEPVRAIGLAASGKRQELLHRIPVELRACQRHAIADRQPPVSRIAVHVPGAQGGDPGTGGH
jgi:hypothetical protein